MEWRQTPQRVAPMAKVKTDTNALRTVPPRDFGRPPVSGGAGHVRQATWAGSWREDRYDHREREAGEKEPNAPRHRPLMLSFDPGRWKRVPALGSEGQDVGVRGHLKTQHDQRGPHELQQR
jgi:hypothetical protein